MSPQPWGLYLLCIVVTALAIAFGTAGKQGSPPKTQPTKPPEQVLIETRAPCPVKPIVVQGQIVWLCNDGNAYETRL